MLTETGQFGLVGVAGRRGIGIPDLVTSDAHDGLRTALRSTLNATTWQRCQFHLQQNAQAYVPKVEMRKQVAADIRSIFSCPDRSRAEQRLGELVGRYRNSASKLAAWLEQAIPEGLTVSLANEVFASPSQNPLPLFVTQPPNVPRQHPG